MTMTRTELIAAATVLLIAVALPLSSSQAQKPNTEIARAKDCPEYHPDYPYCDTGPYFLFLEGKSPKNVNVNVEAAGDKRDKRDKSGKKMDRKGTKNLER